MPTPDLGTSHLEKPKQRLACRDHGALVDEAPGNDARERRAQARLRDVDIDALDLRCHPANDGLLGRVTAIGLVPLLGWRRRSTRELRAYALACSPSGRAVPPLREGAPRAPRASLRGVACRPAPGSAPFATLSPSSTRMLSTAPPSSNPVSVLRRASMRPTKDRRTT